MKLYAAAGVPEVWRYDGERMQIFLLSGGEHKLATQCSHSFPHLTGEQITEYIRLGRERGGSAAMLQAVKADL